MNNKDDMYMSGDDGGSWVGGPRPHGADDEWIEEMIGEDVMWHQASLIDVLTPEDIKNDETSVPFIDKCTKRFIQTFGRAVLSAKDTENHFFDLVMLKHNGIMGDNRDFIHNCEKRFAKTFGEPK